jgi:hypothetical protein
LTGWRFDLPNNHKGIKPCEITRNTSAKSRRDEKILDCKRTIFPNPKG